MRSGTRSAAVADEIADRTACDWL